ncbi:MAG: FecCD family ABC transporter permease [Fusobacteriota bacterium]
MVNQKRNQKYKILFIISIIISLITIIFSVTIGTVKIPFFDAIKIILNKTLNIDFDINKTYGVILYKLRLPRTILSGIIGIGLATIGAVYQSVFKNPMADPYVLGISSGAALGATLGMVFFSVFQYSFTVISIFAFFGAFLTLILVYQIAKVKNILPVVTLLLSGISVNLFFSSLISFVMILKRKQMGEIFFWIMGSVNSATWRDIIVLTPVIFIGSGILYFFFRELNIILTGEETAKTLGIDVEKTKKIILVVSSIMIAFIVASSGIIPFVGLIVPHIVRLLIGSNNRYLIPLSGIFGAIFLMLSDIIARVLISPSELPIGIITALVGTPYFIWLLYKTKEEVFI